MPTTCPPGLRLRAFQALQAPICAQAAASWGVGHVGCVCRLICSAPAPCSWPQGSCSVSLSSSSVVGETESGRLGSSLVTRTDLHKSGCRRGLVDKTVPVEMQLRVLQKAVERAGSQPDQASQ